MSTNVQNLRDMSRWNLFEFRDNKYVPVFWFAGTWEEMSSYRASFKLSAFRACWPHCPGNTDTVILPYGCSY